MGIKFSKGGAKSNLTKCCCYLPDPIVAEIISRLPIQSVLECMCVCKTWHRLITSSHFNYYLLKNRSQQYMTFILREGCKYYFCEIERICFDDHRRGRKAPSPTPPMIKPMIMKTECDVHNLTLTAPVGICNGFICSYSLGTILGTRYRPIIIIWNPILGQYKVLPIEIESTLIAGLGFGYCQVTNQYKVLLTAKKGKKFELEVLTLGSSSNDKNKIDNNTWRKLGKLHGPPNRKYGFCCFEGSIYWLCGCRGSSHSEWICCFDISTEKLMYLPPPHDCAKSVVLEVVGDSLCIVRGTDNGFLLWSMSDRYSGWSKQHIFIDLSRSFNIPSNLSFVTTLWEQDKEILILEIWKNLLYYDYKRMQYVELKTTIDVKDGPRNSKTGAHYYLPSFMPLSQVFGEEETLSSKMVVPVKDNGGCLEFLLSVQITTKFKDRCKLLLSKFCAPLPSLWGRRNPTFEDGSPSERQWQLP